MKNIYNPVSGEFDYVNSVSDSSFVHQQSVASTEWTVNHNLGTRCSIQVVDDTAHEIIADIQWIDNNTVKVSFNTPTTGYVYCN